MDGWVDGWVGGSHGASPLPFCFPTTRCKLTCAWGCPVVDFDGAREWRLGKRLRFKPFRATPKKQLQPSSQQPKLTSQQPPAGPTIPHPCHQRRMSVRRRQRQCEPEIGHLGRQPPAPRAGGPGCGAAAAGCTGGRLAAAGEHYVAGLQVTWVGLGVGVGVGEWG